MTAASFSAAHMGGGGGGGELRDVEDKILKFECQIKLLGLCVCVCVWRKREREQHNEQLESHHANTPNITQ